MKKISAGDSASRSPDLIAENLEQMKALFPEAFTEGRVDFEVLKQLLGGTVDECEEKYGLNWHGKRQARQLALTPSTGTLRPCPEDSVDWDTTQNLMIEGDNLEVLKLLQKSYTGKVKLIYIDPPYNTGKDFIYRDDYNDTIENYLKVTGQVDRDGTKLSSNTEASGRFHTDWLNMMYPRIKLARNLLTEDGLLLVSINDVELGGIRFVLNEVFGEENFLCQFIWNSEGNVDQQSKIKGVHEYVIAYARTVERIARPVVIDPNIEETSKLYNDQIENSITKNGPANPPSRLRLPAGFPAAFDEGTIKKRMDKWPHVIDEIAVQGGVVTNPARIESGWSSKNLLELFLANGCTPIQDSSGKETWFAVTRTGAIYGYKRRSELQGHVLSVIRNVGTTKQTSNRLARWGVRFSYPKPVLLIRYLIQVFTTPGGIDLVLDFFAGSGTTGEAIVDLNCVDGGGRRFILVQLPETAEGFTEAGSTVFDVCRRRVQRAIEHHDLDSTIVQQKTGFRVFKLDNSNVRAWAPDRDDLESVLLDSINHIRDDRSEDDILYELLLKLGLDLCVPIETRAIAGTTVHSVGAGTLIACLVERIASDEVEPLGLGIADWHAELEPAGDTTVVFRDSAFADDVAKTNLTAILEQRGLGNVRSL